MRFAILLPVTKNYMEREPEDHLLTERVFQRFAPVLKPQMRQDVRKKMDNCKNSNNQNNQNNNQNQNNQNNKNQNNNQNKNQNSQNNNY